MRYIIYPEDKNHSGLLGGKGRALAELQNSNLPIPPWFAVSPDAFYASLSDHQLKAVKSAGNTVEIANLLAGMLPNEEIISEVSAAFARICPDGGMVAVRSSALDEDGAQHSFAGQLDSFLFVPAEKVSEKVAEVWCSGFSERVLAYRRENSLDPLPHAPAVLIQRMVNSEMAGVAFSADPVTGSRGTAVVSAVYGLGTALVSGECDADTYHVDREDNIIESHIATKRIAHRFGPNNSEGVKDEIISEDMSNSPALTSSQVEAVAALARQTEQYFGRPQDIEWAIEDGHLYLLQSRPITVLGDLGDPDGELNIWDNSNIAESYNGVTTPLTFSFARCAYEHVYRQFCRILGVSEKKITEHDDTFRRMLGLIQGRVYYNLLSWYRVLALLPGFTVNRRFMEQMMGVKEELPPDLVEAISKATWRERVGDGFRLIYSCGRLVKSHMTLGGSIRFFYQRLDEALFPPKPALELMRPDELMVYYRSLERKLLTRWDAPLVNDFLTMIFYGLLRRCTEKWCGDTDGTLQNGLISGQGGIISAEPAHRMQEMAGIASGHAGFADILCDAPLNAILQEMESLPGFKSAYHEYLEKFGDRCLEELKLESTTLYDDPLLLLRSVGQLAWNRSDKEQPSAGDDMRTLAEERVYKALRWRPLRLVMFNWVAKHARERVRDRENLRFERTRLFGRVRRIFLELGRRFHADGLLDNPRDIFYLEINEAIGVVDGTTSSTDIKKLVEIRKAEFAGYCELPAPASRFETHGVVCHGNSYRSESSELVESSGEERKGIGCCPGIVRGHVRVITDPKNAQLENGSILVAERTDPGWIMLFPAAKGVLVERGSLLSHSAIVAREMRIPAIVSIPGVTSWLKDGDLVEFDGSTGVVRRINTDVEENGG